jgi:adenylate kinase family enzyme
MLRELVAKNGPEAKIIAKALASGRPTPTVIVKKLLQDAISAVPKERGIVMDGTPKLAGEARIVAAAMKRAGRTPLAAYLTISKSEVFKRMEARREVVRGKVIKRSDDNRSSMERRFKYYRTNIAKVVEFLQDRYKYAKISGQGTRSEVAARLEKFIKRNYQ